MDWYGQLAVFVGGVICGLLLFATLRRRLAEPLQRSLEELNGAWSGRVPQVIAELSGEAEVEQPSPPLLPPIDPREQQINDSAQAVRGILLILTAVIERTEQAASESSQALKKLRDSFDRAGLPAEVAAVTSRLTEKIDRMITNNASLREKLASSQKILIAQQRQIEMLRTAVLVDGMTQLANRSYFDDKLSEMIKLRQRYDEPFFLVILDVDHFKSINDTHGHQAGDLILKGVANRIKSVLRDSDFVARFGGDEFAVILIKCTPQAAEVVANKLCEKVRASSFRFEGIDLRVSLSVGGAEATAFDTSESLLERADSALYCVKQRGRDGVCFAENPVV